MAMATVTARITALDILKVYTRISLSGFGGTLFWVRYVLVERKGWLTEQEFVEALALGQLVPGPSVLNMSLMISYRFAGYAGALAAGAGFLGCPFLIVIGIGMLYGRYEHIPLVQQGISGMIAVVVGLLIANGVKMASALPRHWRPWLFTLLAFAGVGVFRWPLIGVLGVLAPLGIAAVWKGKR
jgi:chromate transporter